MNTGNGVKVEFLSWKTIQAMDDDKIISIDRIELNFLLSELEREPAKYFHLVVNIYRLLDTIYIKEKEARKPLLKIEFTVEEVKRTFNGFEEIPEEPEELFENALN